MGEWGVFNRWKPMALLSLGASWSVRSWNPYSQGHAEGHRTSAANGSRFDPGNRGSVKWQWKSDNRQPSQEWMMSNLSSSKVSSHSFFSSLAMMNRWTQVTNWEFCTRPKYCVNLWYLGANLSQRLRLLRKCICDHYVILYTYNFI